MVAFVSFRSGEVFAWGKARGRRAEGFVGHGHVVEWCTLWGWLSGGRRSAGEEGAVERGEGGVAGKRKGAAVRGG